VDSLSISPKNEGELSTYRIALKPSIDILKGSTIDLVFPIEGYSESLSSFN